MILEKSLVTASYSARAVAMGTIEYATILGSLLIIMSDKCYTQQKGIVPLQRSLMYYLYLKYISQPL